MNYHKTQAIQIDLEKKANYRRYMDWCTHRTCESLGHAEHGFGGRCLCGEHAVDDPAVSK